MQSGSSCSGPVVVRDDHVQAGRARGRHRLHRGDAAVDGHEQPHAAPGEALHRGHREPIALVEAARQLPERVGAECTQRAKQHRRGADAVDVVVAEDRDRGAELQVAQDLLARVRNARERARIVRLVGGEESPRLLGLAKAAAGEDRADDRRDAEPARKRTPRRDLVRVGSPPGRLGLHPKDPRTRGGRNGSTRSSPAVRTLVYPPYPQGFRRRLPGSLAGSWPRLEDSAHDAPPGHQRHAHSRQARHLHRALRARAAALPAGRLVVGALVRARGARGGALAQL